MPGILRHNNRVTDLRWEDVKGWFDLEINGDLPDGQVTGTTLEDWRSLVSLAHERGWRLELFEDGREVSPDDRGGDVFARVHEVAVTLRLWLTEEIGVNLWFFSPEEINFDIDLRELQSQQRLDVLCDFLRSVGRRLGKSVLVTPESGSELQTDLSYEVAADRVALVEQPSFE